MRFASEESREQIPESGQFLAVMLKEICEWIDNLIKILRQFCQKQPWLAEFADPAPSCPEPLASLSTSILPNSKI